MYTPLYIQTDNSLQQSIIKIPDLIQYAKNSNIKSLTITDNNMYGVMDFYVQCISNDIKPIIGFEVLYDAKTIILYAINYNGYKNLIKLSTCMSDRDLTINDLERFSNDLICIVPYESIDKYLSLSKLYKYIYKSYKNNNELEDLNSKNTVYMNKTLYLIEKDKKYIKYMDAIRENVTVDLISNTHFDNYIMLEDEYRIKYPNSIENNSFITELCNVEIPFNQPLMPIFTNDENIDSYSYLKKKCIEGLKKHFGIVVNQIYKERLKYELEVINKMGFCDYFLIVSDYVEYARKNNIIVGSGRGSAVGSLVSYCLFITDVDPIKYNLLFERFLNVERISMPDIDIDFEHEKREEVISYCIKKYGEKRVAPIITFGTLGVKQAIRDVAKTINIDLKLIDTLCKLIDSNKSLKENIQDNKDINELVRRKKELEHCIDIAVKFEGLKKHTSIHAAGVVMSNIDLDEIIPLDKSHGFYVSGYDMTYLEKIGLLKMDFLAIKYLTTIHNIIDSINEEYKTNIKFDEIPLNDKKAINIFTTANTVGIFQFESDGMINFLRKLKANNMNDIFAAIALFRPGPMDNISTYIKRKNLKEKFDCFHPSLEPILISTYGIMIYQEQIMQIANVMADYTLGEADVLRKAMSKKKKDLLLKEEKKFYERALKKGYSSDLIKKIYALMLKFASYGFNKSHSIGYSIVAYKMAYLKAYYPKNFITYLLSMEINDLSKTKQYIYEAKQNNINILNPDVTKSFKKYNEEKDGIRYPITNIKNVGIISADIIINERCKSDFIDIYDFVKRCYGKSITTKTLEYLIYSNALSCFSYNKKTLINNLDLIINYAELIKDLDRQLTIEPEIKIEKEYSTKELMAYELDAIGFYLTNNPITELKSEYNNIINLNELQMYFDKTINTIVYVERVKEISTTKGDKMCFILGSDELSQIDIVLFPKVYNKIFDIKEGIFAYITGKVEKRYDKYQIIVAKIEKISR